MKIFMLLHPVFSVLAEEGHPPAAEAIDPFAGGAGPLTTVVLVLLLIIIVWILLRSQVGQVDTSDLEHDHHGHEDHGHAEHHEEEPAPAPAASASPDDLKVLEGLGPKVQSVLNAAGIATYAQLAETPVEKLQEVLDAAGYQYMNPGSWPEQASLAADGDWDALKKLQEELNAGRE